MRRLSSEPRGRPRQTFGVQRYEPAARLRHPTRKMEQHKKSTLRAMDSEYFRVIMTTDKSQTALMNLLPDQDSGEYGTDHAQSDQVLYVIEGTGSAKVEGKRVELEEGDVLLIKAGEKHQIVADGTGTLRTINVYSSVAYPEEK